MRPLHITVTLASPITVPERPIHLDALLAWAAVDAEIGSGADGKTALLAQDTLPLDRTEGEGWTWKASQLVFTPRDNPFLVAAIRSTNIQEMAFDRAAGVVDFGIKVAVNLGTGPDRNYDYRFAAQCCASAEAWCVGDPEKIKALLATLPGIGKRRRNGWGAIKEISVVEVGASECHWNRRTLPMSSPCAIPAAHVPSNGTLRPPYWDRLQYGEVLEYVTPLSLLVKAAA